MESFDFYLISNFSMPSQLSQTFGKLPILQTQGVHLAGIVVGDSQLQHGRIIFLFGFNTFFFDSYV